MYRVGMGTVDVHWKWNNGPNGLHWPVWLILPVFPYPVRHPTSPLGREKINPANAASHQLTHLSSKWKDDVNTNTLERHTTLPTRDA